MREMNEYKAEIFSRMKKGIKQRKRNRNLILTFGTSLCLCLFIGIGVWQGGLFDSQPNIITGDNRSEASSDNINNNSQTNQEEFFKTDDDISSTETESSDNALTNDKQEDVPNNEEAANGEETTGNTQGEAYDNGQSGSWDSGQSGSWDNGQSGSWDSGQSGSWDSGQSGSTGNGPSYSIQIDYKSIDEIFHCSANVYTGTLLEIELYDEYYGDSYGDIYKIKVKVDEVIKGSFKEGEIVEDYCLAHFFDLNCRYLFMTGANIECGYDIANFSQADNVYYGKVLEKERIESPENYPYPLYRFKAEVTEVVKGDYKVGDIVEDETTGRLHDIRDDVLFMTSDNDTYLKYPSLTAAYLIYSRHGNIHSMIKLLGNNKVQYGVSLSERYVYSTEDELMNEVYSLANQKPHYLFGGNPFFPTTPELANIRSKHNCPCEYSESEIEKILKIIEDMYDNAFEDAIKKNYIIENELYCDKHSMDNFLNCIREKGYYKYF